MSTLSTYIHKRRTLKLGITKKALAKRAGLHVASIQRYESGQNIPKGRCQEKLAQGLNVAVYEIRKRLPREGWARISKSHEVPFNPVSFEAFLSVLHTMHNAKGEAYDTSETERYGNWRRAVGCASWVASWNRVREKVDRINTAVSQNRAKPDAMQEELVDIAVLAGITWILLAEAYHE